MLAYHNNNAAAQNPNNPAGGGPAPESLQVRPQSTVLEVKETDEAQVVLPRETNRPDGVVCVK